MKVLDFSGRKGPDMDAIAAAYEMDGSAISDINNKDFDLEKICVL